MRMSMLVLSAALLLASAWPAPARAQQSDESFNPRVWVNVGLRAESVDGDTARFSRFADLSDDAALALDLFGETNAGDWRIVFEGTNVGYEDQRMSATVSGMGKVKASVLYDQVPLNYGFRSDGYVQTPYGADFKLDYETREAVQEGGAIAVPGNPSQRTSYLGFFHPIDLKSRRNVFDGKVAFSPAKDLGIKVQVTSTTRQGHQPWGASFGFSQGVEIARPVNDRTADVDAGLEWGNEKGAVNLNYRHSQFDSDQTMLVWDSPYRVEDRTDSRAYVTGDGTSQGRLSLPPSNTQETFSGTGVARFARRSTVSATFAVSTLKQDGTIIPFTINTAIEPIHLERDHAEAKVNLGTFGFTFNSRPVPNVTLNARYRYFNRDDKTPTFDGEEYVRLDQVFEEGGGETEHFNVTSNTFNAGVGFSGIRYTTFKVDYAYDGVERTHREFAKTAENAIRFSVDSVGSSLLTARVSYEYASRTGSGFSEEVLDKAGQQPDMRHYDVANRNRNRGMVLLTLMPSPMAGITFSMAAGKDKYPDQEFGLLDNSNQVYTVGVHLYPNDQVSFGVVYGYEKYSSLMKSRNASPGPTFTDPNYDWFDDADEKVNSFTVTLDLVKAIENTDLRFGYDYSKSDANFKYSGPNITRLGSSFEQLPTNTNEFNRASVDLRYFFSDKAALNLAYWFDKYSVDDFAVPEPASGASEPRLDPQGAWLLGYFFRPYTAHVGFVRVLFFF